MLGVLEYLFEDFWRFVQFVILLIIAVQWCPVKVNILNDHRRHDDDAE